MEQKILFPPPVATLNLCSLSLTNLTHAKASPFFGVKKKN